MAIFTPSLHMKETIAVPKAAQAVQATVTIKQIAATIAEQHEIAKKQSEAILNDMVGLVTKHLKKGDRIRISGLGILQVRKRAARMGRNPADPAATISAHQLRRPAGLLPILRLRLRRFVPRFASIHADMVAELAIASSGMTMPFPCAIFLAYNDCAGLAGLGPILPAISPSFFLGAC
jgi:nucleoid DNA-binding protein